MATVSPPPIPLGPFPQALPTAHPVCRHLLELESALLQPEVRADRELLEQLLHRDFEEVGASGSVYAKPAIIRLLGTEHGGAAAVATLKHPRCLALSDSCIMLRWRAEGGKASQRCSIWQLSDGRWQLLYHQGTTSPHPGEPRLRSGRRSNDTVAAPSASAVLRPLRLADAPGVLQAFASDPLMLRQGEVTTWRQAQDYTRRLVTAASQQAYAIAIDDGLVGLVCASVDAQNSTGWFWYWMNAAHRGRQLATRASATVANYLLSDGGLHRLELGARRNNPSSLRVARGAGFIQEGLEREKFVMDGERVDVLTFGRLASDPVPSTAQLPLLA